MTNPNLAAGYKNANLVKNFIQLAMATGDTPRKVFSLGDNQKRVIWMRVSSSAGGPTVSLKLFDVVPEPANADSPAAGDEIQHGATISQAGDGLKRVEIGQTEATPTVLGDKMDYQLTMAGGGASANVEVWTELM